MFKIDCKTAINMGTAKNNIKIFPPNSTFEAILLDPASLHISLQKDAM